MIHRIVRRVLPVVAVVLAASALPAAAQVVTPPAISPGGGPQRWNVVDGVQKLTIPGYQAAEAGPPAAPVVAKTWRKIPATRVKRTRAVLEDAVFVPLNNRKATKHYRYGRP
jgi:hypothetical protein